MSGALHQRVAALRKKHIYNASYSRANRSVCGSDIFSPSQEREGAQQCDSSTKPYTAKTTASPSGRAAPYHCRVTQTQQHLQYNSSIPKLPQSWHVEVHTHTTSQQSHAQRTAPPACTLCEAIMQSYTRARCTHAYIQQRTRTYSSGYIR